jgi:ABC-type multidrug transport system ATPase subunit
MKRRLNLAAAIVHRPRILFLDEPTTGVDAVSRREFWDLLAALRDQGLTIVVATPYMDEAARCDRIALLQGGRVLAVDRPADVGARYPRPLFAARAADRVALLRILRAYPHAASAWPFGETIHVSDRRVELAPARLQAELAAHLAAAGLADAVVSPIAPGIEDTFIELMGAPSPRAA